MMIDAQMSTMVRSLPANNHVAPSRSAAPVSEIKPFSPSQNAQGADHVGRAQGITSSAPILAAAALSALQEVEPVAPIRRDDAPSNTSVNAGTLANFQQASDAYAQDFEPTLHFGGGASSDKPFQGLGAGFSIEA